MPWDKTWVAPRQAARPPSVTTKAGTFSLAMAKPWISPAPAPTATAASTATRTAAAARVGVADIAPVAPLGDRRTDHAGKGDHRADREVDAAGEDDEGHADGQDAVDEVLPQEEPEVALAGEGGLLIW